MTNNIFRLNTVLVFVMAILAFSCSKKGTDPADPPGPTDPNKPDPPVVEENLGIKMVNTTKVLYYGDRQTAGVYNYFLGLCDKEFIKDEEGDDAAPEGGSLVFFDIYSNVASESFETAVLPNGEYTLSADKAAGTMNNYFTRLQILENGKQKSVDFASGTLVVSNGKKENEKLLKAEFKLTDGTDFKCYYEGPLVFGDPDEGSDEGIPTLTEPVNQTFVWAGGEYFGDEYNTGTDRFAVSFTTAPLNSENMMSAAGYNVVLSIYSEASTSIIELAPGTYNVNDTYAAGTIEPGEFVTSYIGSYCVRVDNNANATELSFINGGTVTIAKSGTGYKVEMNLTTPEGVSVKGVYEGEIEFKDSSQGGGNEEEITTTLESDYVLNLENATAELIYYGDFYECGKANWVLSIYDETKDAIDIDFLTENVATPTMYPIPTSGQYNMSVDNGVGVVAGQNTDWGMMGTWYVDLSTQDADGYVFGYAAAIEGNFKTVKNADNTYTINFEFVDEAYNLFSGSWTGVIPAAEDKSSSVSTSAKTKTNMQGIKISNKKIGKASKSQKKSPMSVKKVFKVAAIEKR